jgi:putative hydrolases of HD superfamily
MDQIDLIRNALKITKLKRSGWVAKEIKEPESVADHSYGAAFLAMTIDLPEGLDRCRVIKMALIHDVGESIIGDIIWEKGDKTMHDVYENKRDKEEAALKEIFKDHPEELELSIEFYELKTPTAKFVKELDKLEMAFQALAYEEQVSDNRLIEFWENTEKYLISKETIKLFEELKKLRKEIRN